MTDYLIKAGGVALSTIVPASRLVKWTAGQKRGGNFTLPYQHGEVSVPDKYFTGADVLIEVKLPTTTTASASQALSELQALWSVQGLTTVEYTDPFKGTIQARTELLAEPVPTQSRIAYLFVLRNPAGFWEDVSASSAASASPPSVTTGGDRPIDDMTLTFAGPGYLEHTDSLGQVARITIEAGAGAGSYVVDVKTGTATKSGANQDEFLDLSQPWGMKWQPDSTPALTSSVAVAASWSNKWA